MFFRRDFPTLVAFLMKDGFSRDDAADATEEAMVEAHVQWDRIREPRRWVRTVARRHAIKAARRRRRGVQKAVRGGWLSSAHDDRQRIAAVDEHSRVVALLARLPGMQRSVMAYHIDGLTTAEIADALGLGAATVRSHLRHAREKLKIAMKQLDSSGQEGQ